MSGVRVYEPPVDPSSVAIEVEVQGDGSNRQVVKVADYRPLAERMFARAPQSGYSLWLDTADATYIYIAEAPTADDGTATTFQGIRVTKDASGNPLGKVQTATGFAWDSRGSASWL